MAIVTPGRSNFDEREVDYKSGVSEALLTKQAAQHNFLNQKHYISKQFNINGPYRFVSGDVGQDGIWVVPFDAEIFEVSYFNIKAGTSGTTTLDVKRATTSGGAFTTIFSTPVSITSAASNNVFGIIGSSLTGVTAPILNSVVVSEIDGKTVYEVDAGDALRFDLTAAMPVAENCGLVVYLRSR